MIASIRSHVESIGTEVQPQRILKDIARHTELIVVQAGKENQEQQAAEDFRKITQYFEEFCESHEQLRMNGSSVSARNYPKGGVFMGQKKLQGSKLNGFLKQQRISGHLVITRASRNDCMDGKCMQLSMGIYRWQRNAMAKGTRVSGKHRGVSAESSGEASDHLQ